MIVKERESWYMTDEGKYNPKIYLKEELKIETIQEDEGRRS